MTRYIGIDLAADLAIENVSILGPFTMTTNVPAPTAPTTLATLATPDPVNAPEHASIYLSDRGYLTVTRLPYYIRTRTRGDTAFKLERIIDHNNNYHHSFQWLYDDMLTYCLNLGMLSSSTIRSLLDQDKPRTVPFEEIPHIVNGLVSYFGLSIRPLIKECKTTTELGKFMKEKPTEFVLITTGVSFGKTPAELKAYLEKLHESKSYFIL